MSKEDHVNDRSLGEAPAEEQSESAETPQTPNQSQTRSASGGSAPATGGGTTNT